MAVDGGRRMRRTIPLLPGEPSAAAGRSGRRVRREESFGEVAFWVVAGDFDDTAPGAVFPKGRNRAANRPTGRNA